MARTSVSNRAAVSNRQQLASGGVEKLLMETGDLLLLETGDAILLESSGATARAIVSNRKTP